MGLERPIAELALAEMIDATALRHALTALAKDSSDTGSLRKDGLGLMVVEPHCSGQCEVELEFGPTTETWISRLLSGAASVLLLLLVIRRSSGSDDSAPRAKRRLFHPAG